MAKYFAQVNYHHEYRKKSVSAEMEIDLGRFEKQYGKAQYRLDSTVMTDMVPFMPMRSGLFVNVTRAMSASIAGSGKVVAAAPPFGRFLYEGEVMVGVKSGSPFAQPAEKKKATGRPLQYTKTAHPDAQSHWFDAAKRKNLKKWVSITKETAGGGE